MGANQTYKVLSDMLVRLLRPLVRLMLRNGVTFQAFAELAKSVFVEIAAEEFRIAGRKQSDSRISVITGLTRKEVKRITNTEKPQHAEEFVRYNRAARVISGWLQDERFTDRHGEPRDLQFDGKSPSFQELVRNYSGDAPARAVLDELERVGAAARLSDGRVTLLTRAYIPQVDDADKVAVLGTTVFNLLDTIEHNFWGEGGEPYFQRMIANRAIPADQVGEFHMLAQRKGQQLLESLDQWLSEHEVRGEREYATDTRHVGLGMYYFEN